MSICDIISPYAGRRGNCDRTNPNELVRDGQCCLKSFDCSPDSFCLNDHDIPFDIFSKSAETWDKKCRDAYEACKGERIGSAYSVGVCVPKLTAGKKCSGRSSWDPSWNPLKCDRIEGGSDDECKSPKCAQYANNDYRCCKDKYVPFGSLSDWCDGLPGGTGCEYDGQCLSNDCAGNTCAFGCPYMYGSIDFEKQKELCAAAGCTFEQHFLGNTCE